MNFQEKVNTIFGPTLYQNYNEAISSVIGSKIKNEDEIVKGKQQDDIEER